MEVDDMLQELLQEPVQEDSNYQLGSDLIVGGKPMPLVSLEKDYFMSSAGSQQQQQADDEDMLNLITQNGGLLQPPSVCLPPVMKRTDSIQQLFQQLEDGQTEGMPTDLVDVELQEIDLCSLQAELQPQPDADSSNVDQVLQQAMQGGSSTSNTSMAMTYEYQSLQVTHLPISFIRYEEQQQQQQQQQQLAPRLHSLKLEQQEPQQQQQQPQLPMMMDEVAEPQQQKPELPKLSVFGGRASKAADACRTAGQLLPESQPELESPVSEVPPSPKPAEEDPDAGFTVRAAEHIKGLIGRMRNQPTVSVQSSMNAKPQVQEFVLAVLLHQEVCGCDLPLELLMDFCDCNGHPSGTDRSHFSAKDTKAIGFLWQKLKGNRNANYDTFARAMRVGRERSKGKGFFDYLESGKGSKKRVYRLASKGEKELQRVLELLLRKFSQYQ